MRLMRVVGARPQFMQEAAFRRAVDARGHKEILVHTGQHYDPKMSRVFFEELCIPYPEVNLGVGSGSHGQQTGRMLELLDETIEKYRPDVLVVDGDTNSTLAGALAASKLDLPVVHVEAGLRSYDRSMPEEVNRVVADHLSALLCAPTTTAMTNLGLEGLAKQAVLTGDLMYDCFLHFRALADDGILQTLHLSANEYLLATIHRAENTENEGHFRGIIEGLCTLPRPVVLPAHPRTRAKLKRLEGEIPRYNGLTIIEPVSYLQMLALEQQARCILTDSGGVQREAFFMRKPSVVLRRTTEWREQVDSGWSYVAGVSASEITKGYHFLSSQKLAEPPDIYGDGRAATKIIEAIETRFA